MAQRQLLPFRMYTRQRDGQVSTSQPISALGDSAQFIMQKVGLLNYLVVFVRATVNLSSAGVLADLGPWSLIKNIRVDLNLGNMNVVDMSGYSAYQLAKKLFRGFGLDGAGNYTPNANVYSAPVASGNNSWVIPFIIPISANPGSQFDTGLISLQAPEIQLTVTIRTNSTASEVVSNFNTISNFTVEMHQVYFEYPNPQAVMLPPGQIVRTVEYTQPIVATGANIYTVERQGRLLQLISTIRANGARTDGIDDMRLIANINDTIYLENIRLNKFLQEMQISSPSNTGIFGLDLWHSGENPSAGDGRDLINTEVLTTLQWQATVSSSTVLGSGNNFFTTLRRVLVDFAQPTLGPSV